MSQTLQSVKRDGHLVVQASELCNLRCRFCMIGTDHGHMDKYSSDDIRRMLLHYSDRCSTVSFSGGEPTLRPDLPDMVREAVTLGYQVDIVSNGRLYAHKDFCERLIKAGVTYYFISIHAPNRELYKELTKVDAFDQAVAGIKNLVGLGQKVITGTVVSKYSYQYLDEMAQLIVKLGVKSALLRFYRPGVKIPEGDVFVMPDEKLNDILESVERAAIYLYRSGVDPKITFVPRCILPSCSKFIKRYIGILEGRPFYPKPGEEFYPKIDTGEDFEVFTAHFWKDEGCKECIYDKYCDGVKEGMPFKPKPIKYSPLGGDIAFLEEQVFKPTGKV